MPFSRLCIILWHALALSVQDAKVILLAVLVEQCPGVDVVLRVLATYLGVSDGAARVAGTASTLSGVGRLRGCLRGRLHGRLVGKQGAQRHLAAILSGPTSFSDPRDRCRVYVNSLILILGAELSSEYGRLKTGLDRGVNHH